jgi:hypothetical protein
MRGGCRREVGDGVGHLAAARGSTHGSRSSWAAVVRAVAGVTTPARLSKVAAVTIPTSPRRTARLDALARVGLAGMYESVLVGEDDRLYAVAQIEFGEDPRDVGFHGAVADVERLGDLGV